MIQNDLLKQNILANILTKNINFTGHLSTFEAENTTKIGPFMAGINALNPQKKWKSQEIDLFDPQY